jgi:hypothetical protein
MVHPVDVDGSNVAMMGRCYYGFDTFKNKENEIYSLYKLKPTVQNVSKVDSYGYRFVEGNTNAREEGFHLRYESAIFYVC